MSSSNFKSEQASKENFCFIIVPSRSNNCPYIESNIQFIKFYLYSFLNEDLNKIFILSKKLQYQAKVYNYKYRIYIESSYFIQHEDVISDLILSFTKNNEEPSGYFGDQKPKVLIEKNSSPLDIKNFRESAKHAHALKIFKKDAIIQATNNNIKTLQEDINSQINRVFPAPFLFNNEDYFHKYTGLNKEINLFTLAAGFKGNYIVDHVAEKVKNIFYLDINNPSLQLRKQMVNEWSGEDFPKWVSDNNIIKKYGTTEESINDISKFWEKELETWKGARSFKRNWQKIQLIDSHYICIDLIEELDKLKNLIKSSNCFNILWISNVWDNSFTFLKYGSTGRMNKYINWCYELSKIDPDLFLYQSEINFPTKIFYRTNDTIKNIYNASKNYFQL